MQHEQVIEIARKLNAGQAGVIPTDTIYGIVAATKFPLTIDRIYHAKGRQENKKLIILIAGTNQLADVGVEINQKQKNSLKQLWPGPVSAELPCVKPGFEHLNKDSKCMLVRLPALNWLKDLIEITGPIVATSANKSGLSVSLSMKQVKDQLPGLDFYIEGAVGSIPSRLIRINNDGTTEWLKRE